MTGGGTWVSITPQGRKALKRELAALRRIMAQVDESQEASELAGS